MFLFRLRYLENLNIVTTGDATHWWMPLSLCSRSRWICMPN